MKSLYEVQNSEPVSDLLARVEKTHIVLPHFQRSFVWPVDKTRSLLASMAAGYPAGTMLAMKLDSSNSAMMFGLRSFEGAPDVVPGKQEHLVLDGQQRITSLYHTFYGKGEHQHFLNIGEFIESPDLENLERVLISLSPSVKRDLPRLERYSQPQHQATDLVFPLSVMGTLSGRYVAWYMGVCTSRGIAPGDDLYEQLALLEDGLIDRIFKYQFPWLVLRSDTPHEAVATVFDVVNNTGQRLSVFDLVVARTWSPGLPTIQDRWDSTSESDDPHLQLISEFDLKPIYALYVCSVLATGGTEMLNEPSCSRGAVLGLSQEDLETWWDKGVAGLGGALSLLSEQCGVLAPKWLPYEPVLVPLAASLALSADAKGLARGELHSKLKRWFWASCLGAYYDQGAPARMASDARSLFRWVRGGDEPEAVRELAPEDLALSLADVTPRNRAVYKALMCLSNSNDPMDFLDLQPLSFSAAKRRSVDDHHVFPKAFVGRTPDNQPAGVNSILNRTLIDSQSNRILGKQAPSQYFGSILESHGRQKTERLLRGHPLPASTDSPLFSDDFAGFLSLRKNLFHTAIQRAVSAPGTPIP